MGLSNVKTAVMGRVDSDTNVSKADMHHLLDHARQYLPFDGGHVWNANINGIVIRLTTNNDHLIDFWIDNWFPAPLEVEGAGSGVRAHGRIYAVVGVPDHKPFAYYCSESKTALFINSDYYGQCKSWALGMAADIMEMEHDIHSIHGAVVDIGGCGIAIIAPTGTGKSTHSYGLTLRVPNARLHSDDWCYVDYIGGEHGRASTYISERKFYLRTDIANIDPRLGDLFQRCKLENVGETWDAVRNSRAMLDPYWIGGRDKFVYTTRIRAVILLRRDKTSPPEVKLDPDEAIEVLRKGEYTVLPGAGPEEDWGKIKTEPFYNPYLLVRDEERTEMQVRFFRQLFKYAGCHILNTGVETVQQSHDRIMRIAAEATENAMRSR